LALKINTHPASSFPPSPTPPLLPLALLEAGPATSSTRAQSYSCLLSSLFFSRSKTLFCMCQFRSFHIPKKVFVEEFIAFIATPANNPI
jgi:hypothetical protein